MGGGHSPWVFNRDIVCALLTLGTAADGDPRRRSRPRRSSTSGASGVGWGPGSTGPVELAAQRFLSLARLLPWTTAHAIPHNQRPRDACTRCPSVDSWKHDSTRPASESWCTTSWTDGLQSLSCDGLQHLSWLWPSVCLPVSICIDCPILLARSLRRFAAHIGCKEAGIVADTWIALEGNT